MYLLYRYEYKYKCRQCTDLVKNIASGDCRVCVGEHVGWKEKWKIKENRSEESGQRVPLERQRSGGGWNRELKRPTIPHRRLIYAIEQCLWKTCLQCSDVRSTSPPAPLYTREGSSNCYMHWIAHQQKSRSVTRNKCTYATSVWLVMMFSRWLISAPTNVILSVEAENSFCCRCATYRQTVVNYYQTEPTLNFISLFSQISCVGCLVLASLAPNQTFPLIWRVPKTK